MNNFKSIIYFVLSFLFFLMFIKPLLFPRMPTTLEIYVESYKAEYGKEPDLPDYLKKDLENLKNRKSWQFWK